MNRKKRIGTQTIYIPPRLEEKLSAIRSCPLTLVEAPAGFGKTTALEHFFRTQVPSTLPVYSYDFEQDDVRGAWRQFCIRIAFLDETCARRLLRAGVPGEDSISAIGRALRELSCPWETYLWLDNFRSFDVPCAGVLLELLSHCGGALHIVVSTRPLPRETRDPLLSGGRCLCLGEEDLRFTPADAAAYYRLEGADLPARTVEEAHLLTGGRVMALYLQLLSWQDTGRLAPGVLSQLMDTVFWPHLTLRQQEFLLRFSVFPRVNLIQASMLSGHSPEEADRLFHSNHFFLSFDPDSRCFFPHAMLRELLARRFAALSEDRQRDIWQRAGMLAETERDWAGALRFYYLSGDRERLFSLPLDGQIMSEAVDGASSRMVMDLLENTPVGIRRRHPRALVPLAFSLFFTGGQDALPQVQGDIRRTISESDLDQRGKNSLLGELELLLSFMEFNRLEDMHAHHLRALELLDGPAKLISLNSTWTFGSPSILFLFWRSSGMLNRELDQMEKYIPCYCQLTQGHGYGAELIMRAEAAFVRGDPEGALPLCYRGLFAADSRDQNGVYLCGLFLLCRIAVQLGDSTQLESARQAIRTRTLRFRSPMSLAALDLIDGYLALLLGKPEEVPGWLFRGDITEKGTVPISQPFAFIICGRTLLFRKEYTKVLGICEHCLEMSSRFPNLLPQVYANLYIALSMAALGRKEAALEKLQRALDLAMPDRIYMPFAENFHLLKPLFQLLPGSCPGEREIARLYRQYERAWGGITRRFTPRERDILALLRENLTNRLIAERLGLSPNTVRNTVSGMLKKKGLSTRDQLKQLNGEI